MSDDEAKDGKVEFREIAGFPAYRVGSDGSVWSRWGRGGPGRRPFVLTWHRLKPGAQHSGHLGVNLFNDSGANKRLVHRLVLEAFVGPAPDGCECCHNDGNPANNNLSNLRWDTGLANSHDMDKHGTRERGSQRAWAKLDEERVTRLLADYKPGVFGMVRLAKKYGINLTTVHRIIHGIIWKHVPRPSLVSPLPPPPSPNPAPTDSPA